MCGGEGRRETEKQTLVPHVADVCTLMTAFSWTVGEGTELLLLVPSSVRQIEMAISWSITCLGRKECLIGRSAFTFGRRTFITSFVKSGSKGGSHVTVM